MNTQRLFQDEEVWQRSNTTRPAPRPAQPFWLIPMSIVASAVIALFFILGRVSHGEAASVPPPASNPGTQFLIVTPTVLCVPGVNYLDIITVYEQRSEYAQASSTADIALRTPNLCEKDKSLLAGKAILAGYEALTTGEFQPEDQQAQQQTVDQYYKLKQRAREYGVLFPSDLQIAHRAYRIGAFLLAKHVLEHAFTAGEFTTADRDVLQLYVSTLHNLGKWKLAAGTSTTRTEGAQLLVASHRIAVAYKTGQAEAWGLLQQAFGPESKWPAPAETPLLEATTIGDIQTTKGGSQ